MDFDDMVLHEIKRKKKTPSVFNPEINTSLETWDDVVRTKCTALNQFS